MSLNKKIQKRLKELKVTFFIFSKITTTVIIKFCIILRYGLILNYKIIYSWELVNKEEI